MSDSDDSDYIVEEFIKPATVRHTYKKDEDLISGSDDSDNEKNESASEEDEVEDSEAKNNTKCVEAEDEPARPNNRFILYVTNLSGETTKTMLEDFFGDCGKVKSIRIPKVRLGCYAFVEMLDFEGFKVG
jgi:RNA recognition motif-containing protein